MRIFNTQGPVRPNKHYHVAPLSRIDLNEMQSLIEWEKYFVLHAPRQTGKTSILLALADVLNSGGKYRCVYANVEAGQAMREDVSAVIAGILSELNSRARDFLHDDAASAIRDEVIAREPPGAALTEFLVRSSEADSKPLVLLIDEIDSLVGDSLISVLRQLRAGYDRKPLRFPQSIVLCGVRDVRDYRIYFAKDQDYVLGGSAFNIKAESLRLGDFTEREVRTLLGQHVAETGQEFTEEALAEVWNQTLGQPWLVNAVAYECCFRDRAGRDRSRPVSLASVRRARERLILRRDTHLVQLLEKLKQPRLRRVIEPLLSGGKPRTQEGDIEYARDMGLVARQDPLAIANPIYREIIPRALTSPVQSTITHSPAWFVGEDGRLLVGKLLQAFQQFFRQESEHWLERFDYHEAGPHLLLQAFLQRIVSSGGRVEREYGLGRKRTDLLIFWPAADEETGPRRSQKAVIECKLRHGSVEATVSKGVAQTVEYMDRANTDEGHLVIFDRTKGATWQQKIFRRKEESDGRQVTVWGM